jgi:hypothetical protein
MNPYSLDDLHELAKYELGDAGWRWRLINGLYRTHVWFLRKVIRSCAK